MRRGLRASAGGPALGLLRPADDQRELPNDGKTLIGQLIDPILVIFIAFRAHFFRGDESLGAMAALVGGNYLFKLVVALADRIPSYIGVGILAGYLRIDPHKEQHV